MADTNKTVDVKCDSCRRVIFRRQGDTLITYGFTLDMKRSHNIKCNCGEGSAMFCVGREKTIDQKREIG